MTLFVGGVHAVGKTFVLVPVCKELGLRHATASQLIKEQRGFSNWTAGKKVANVDENQRALVAAIRRLDTSGEGIVLDGHFVLRRDVNIHEEIDVRTFAELAIRGVILLEAQPATILTRLQARGDDTWTLAEIADFASRERRQGELVCRSLAIPLITFENPTEADVRRAILGQLRNG